MHYELQIYLITMATRPLFFWVLTAPWQLGHYSFGYSAMKHRWQHQSKLCFRGQLYVGSTHRVLETGFRIMPKCHNRVPRSPFRLKMVLNSRLLISPCWFRLCVCLVDKKCCCSYRSWCMWFVLAYIACTARLCLFDTATNSWANLYRCN